jgi:hypothetical protein
MKRPAVQVQRDRFLVVELYAAGVHTEGIAMRMGWMGPDPSVRERNSAMRRVQRLVDQAMRAADEKQKIVEPLPTAEIASASPVPAPEPEPSPQIETVTQPKLIPISACKPRTPEAIEAARRSEWRANQHEAQVEENALGALQLTGNVDFRPKLWGSIKRRQEESKLSNNLDF